MTHPMYVPEKTAPPRVGVLFGVGLLAAAVALAASVVAERGVIRLGERVRPSGWRVSFRPPAGWQEAGLRDASAEYQAWRPAPLVAGDRRELSVGRVADASNQAGVDLCRRAMFAYFDATFGRLAAWAVERSTPMLDARLGPLEAAAAWVELKSATRGHLFVAAVAPATGRHQEGYVIEYHADRPLSKRDKKLCEAVAESFELVGNDDRP